MTKGTTFYGDISPRTAALAAREMLRAQEPHLVLAKFGATKPLPANSTDTVKFRRPVPYEASTIPLQEGVTPDPDKFAYEDVSVQLHQYGRWSQLTDWIMDTHEDPVLRDMTDQMAKTAAATNEQIIYSAVRGGTNVFYANGASRSAVNTAVTLNKLRAVVRALKAQKALKITKILDSSPNYGSTHVEAAYVAVCHTNVEQDIRGLPGFKSTAEYGSRKIISDHEFGSVEDIRFVTSADLDPFADAGGAKGSMVSTSGTSADVYPILVFGEDAFAQVPLKGKTAMTPIVVNPKPANGDPLGQRGSVGFKFATAALILNELWMARLEVAVTAI